jgi:cobalt-zinc-cadmium efflux system protein
MKVGKPTRLSLTLPNCYCCMLSNRGDDRAIWVVLILTVSSAILEFWVGTWQHSRPLFLEAQHLAIDGGSLLLLANLERLQTLVPQWFAPRLQAIVALINALGLSIGMLHSALETWMMPTVHWSAPSTAMVGCVASYISMRLLSADQSPDLNRRGILLHVNADLLSACCTLLVAAIGYLWPNDWIDPIGSLGIALIICCHALPLIHSSCQQLLAIGAASPQEPAPKPTLFSLSNTYALGPGGVFHSLTDLVLGAK